MDASRVYLEHLEAINQISKSLCKRHGVFGADAEDFASEVRLKLLEDDYAVIRKHRGDSTVNTFLTVVIGNLFRDYRIKMWGKWRPSAEARRSGDTAVLLETAMYRDGRTFEDACTWLENSGRVRVERKELRLILDKLPRRTPRRMEDSDQLEDVPSVELTNGALLAAERRQKLDMFHRAVARILATLESEDQLIIRLRFYEGFSIADVARALGIPQKPLYPRINRLLQTLSNALISEGIGRDVLDFFEPA